MPNYSLDDLRRTRILITGGAGMLGSAIARLASSHGAQVTIVDALLPLYGGNLFNLHGIADKITFIKGDIRDRDCLRAALKDQDLIFSLAAQVSYVDSNLDPFLDMDINCRGLVNILEECRSSAPKAKIVFSSSRFVYGRITSNPVDEKHPFNCLSIYGIHKLAGEKYHRFYYDYHGLKTCSLRISNPYGPRQQMKHSKYGILNWFIRQALEQKPLTIYGDGMQKRDYVYVNDLAEAFLAAGLSDATTGGVYNVGSGTGTAFLDMAGSIVANVPGSEIKMLEWPQDRYFVETGDYISDITRLSEDTGWRPRTPIAEGIKETIDYYVRYRPEYW
ncbi:MAG: NAD-dependent epimerase/dehydratase family protein [Candidatus Aminicenantales bacterium]